MYLHHTLNHTIIFMELSYHRMYRQPNFTRLISFPTPNRWIWSNDVPVLMFIYIAYTCSTQFAQIMIHDEEVQTRVRKDTAQPTDKINILITVWNFMPKTYTFYTDVSGRRRQGTITLLRNFSRSNFEAYLKWFNFYK